MRDGPVRLPLILVVLLLPTGAAEPLFWAVVPDLPGPGPGDEAFALWSPEDAALDGWSFTDGEATWRFPPGTSLPASTPVWFAADPDLWGTFGMPPATRWEGPQLANDGDEAILRDSGGRTVDAFAWGDGTVEGIEGSVSYRSPGLVYRRLVDAQGPRDTDHADDWRTPRTHRVGESALDAPVWQVDAVTTYASPDSSHAVLTGLLAEAQERVALHVYGLRSATLADALVDAAARVPVDVLVTASPVGLSSEGRHETAWALSRIEAAGGEAWLAGTGRYDFHHLKVLVVDDAVAIQSENWVPSGVPADPSWGNRGWGIVLHDAEAADWFAGWMAADRAAWDTEPFDLAGFDPYYQEPVRLPARTGSHQPVPAHTFPGPITVRPVVAPDHTADPATDPVAGAASAASSRLLVQQLDLSLAGKNRLGWTGDDPLLAAIAEAADRGATVKVQAAAPFASDDHGNREALARLSRHGVATSQTVPPALATLHNKGVVADDAVVVGSMNGNHHSRSENREVAVIVVDARVADWYAARFAADWPEPWPLGSEVPGLAAPSLLVVLGLAARRWPSTRSPGSPSH